MGAGAMGGGGLAAVGSTIASSGGMIHATANDAPLDPNQEMGDGSRRLS